MKKYILSGAVVVIILAVIIFERTRPAVSTEPNPITTSAVSDTSVPAGSATPPSSAPVGATSTPVVSAPVGMYKDGEYTGTVANVIYGNTQVKAVISGGKITDVQFLQYPSEPAHSKEVSLSSLPILKSEAIAAQSAQVDSVSGATQTSEAFTQSLASALSQAKS